MRHPEQVATLGLSAVAALVLVLCGCDFGVVYVDPPVEFQAGGLVIEGDPHLELGIYEEQLYVPYEDGDDCPIVHGLQGGNWTHPALRTTGIGPAAVVDCRLVMGDEVVGEAKSKTNFLVTTDGILELPSYPLGVVHPDPTKLVEELYGLEATLECEVFDDLERGDSASVTLTLTEG